MIGRLLGRGGDNVSAALLLRDAARASRRWHTYAMRSVFSASLFGLVLMVIWAVTSFNAQWLDPANLAWAGRGMFVAFGVLQVLLAALFAPFAVAQAVIEERENNTIELLMLTRLQARQILVAKVTARLLVLLTLILGALPVLGLVVTLGGVSVVEVVAVTVHAMTTVVVLGVMGGFFGVFTRSPVLATLAALSYGFLAFGLMPLLYVTLTGDYRALAHFSPLFGTVAEDWWSLLPAVSYAPIVAMTLLLGARFYELRVSGARLRHFFAAEAWSARWMKWGSILLVLTFVFLLPLAIGSWWFSLQSYKPLGASMALWEVALNVGLRAGVWGWCAGLLLACTWLYLRLSMDMVMMADDMLGPARARKGKARAVHVWRNPVAWRELRGKTWKLVAPAIGVWLLVLLGIFQMGVWVVPGGLLGVGGVNAGAALVMTVWLAAGTIERERRDGSLEVLLTTTMNAVEIMIGKALGAALPTAALLLLSLPMLVLGAPHLHLIFMSTSEEGFALVTLKGLVAFVWIGGLWLFTLALSMLLALVLRTPRHAYGAAIVAVGGLVLVPAIAALFGADIPLVAIPARLLVPVLVARPTLWEMLLSTAGMSTVAVVMFVVCCVKLRKWGLADA